MIPLAVWLAAATDTPAPAYWWELLGQYSVLGATVAVLFLFARQQVKREQDRADRLEAQLTALHAATAEKVIPALVAATQTIEEVQSLVRDMARDRGR